MTDFLSVVIAVAVALIIALFIVGVTLDLLTSRRLHRWPCAEEVPPPVVVVDEFTATLREMVRARAVLAAELAEASLAELDGSE